MSVIIEKLLIVQEKDTRIRHMERELKDIPTRKGEEMARLEGHKKAAAEAKDALKAQQLALKKLEGDADGKRGQIVKLRQQQMSLKTNKEFKAMEDEIKGVEAGISGVEDQEIVFMEEQEKIKADIAEKEKALLEEEAVVLRDVKALDLRAAGIEREISDLRTAREESAKDIDKRWLAQYERIFAAKEPALVQLEDGICCGCHMKLPPSVVHEARRQTDMVTCNYCARLLY